MPAGFFVDGKLTYKPLVSVVTEFASTPGLGPANKVLAVVGEFPFLEKDIPYLFTSQAAFLGTIPVNNTMRELANLIYNPSTAAPFNGSPAGVILLNAQPSTQPQGFLKDLEAANSIKLLANTWGLQGNSTVVTVTRASDGAWSVKVANRGVSEEFSAPSGVDMLELDYDHPGGTAGIAYGFDSTGGGSGVLTLQKDSEHAQILFSRTLPSGLARASTADAVSWIPDAPVTGVISITPAPGGTMSTGGSLAIHISGVDAAGALASETVTFTEAELEAATPDPKVTAKTWSAVASLQMVKGAATYSGEITVEAAVTTELGPDSGQETVAQAIQYLNSIKGFTATTASFRAAATPFAQLDMAGPDTLPASLHATRYSLLYAIQNRSQLVSAEDLTTGGAGPLDIAVDTAVSISLLGGTQSATASTDWQSGFLALATSPVTVLFPYSNDHEVQVAALDHVKYMWGRGQRECQLVVAPTPNSTLSELNVKRRDLTDFRVTMLPHSVRVRNPDGSTSAYSTLYNGLLFAAMQCGNPEIGLPMGGARPRVLAFTGHSSIMGTEGADLLLENSMTPLEDLGDGIRVVRWVTTYSEDNDPVRTEGSAVEALAFSNIAVRTAVRPFLNTKATPAVAPAIRSTIAAEVSGQVYRGILRSWQPDSLIVQETDSAYVARYTISPVLPVNHIAITSVAIAFPIS
jgi:hypothetical protein